jgi:hypothetical protein
MNQEYVDRCHKSRFHSVVLASIIVKRLYYTDVLQVPFPQEDKNTLNY